MKFTNRVLFLMWYLLSANTTFAFTHSDTLRGSNGSGREWWDVMRYDLQITIDTANRMISGSNTITFKVLQTPNDSMQLDLQNPMEMDSVVLMPKNEGDRNQLLPIMHEENVWWVKYPFHKLKTGERYSITVYYKGKPRAAVNPPWDGGFSWVQDNTGKPWISVSCQGLGASCWWPCKDAQWDEPDEGMATRFAASGMFVVSNGKNMKGDDAEPGTLNGISGWVVNNPINNYDVTFYLGDYIHWHDTIMGEKGKLDLDFYVLRPNEAKARKHFAVVKQMIHCFEYWMGPYPFYEDGYKLVESPYLGMEHQSAIAYGNKYNMGYAGGDRTGTGIGLEFDYIIIHESGHEWFGNNITAKDIADNWIHEGITCYTEALFAECLLGREKAFQYCRGEWRGIQNDKPVIGKYGINDEGSNDMYDKGAAIVHMIRVMMNDDEKFRSLLRGLNKDFYHQTVTTEQIENYFIAKSGLDLRTFFDQYLRTPNIPKLEYYVKDNQLNFRFLKAVGGFSLPITVSAGSTTALIKPTSEWQQVKWKGGYNVTFSKDFLIRVE